MRKLCTEFVALKSIPTPELTFMEFVYIVHLLKCRCIYCNPQFASLLCKGDVCLPRFLYITLFKSLSSTFFLTGSANNVCNSLQKESLALLKNTTSIKSLY